MLKLYRRENGRIVAYHEAWVYGSRIMEHWGPLGERGDLREHRQDDGLSDDENVARILEAALADGFRPIADEEHSILLIEYPIDGMGNVTDLDKRHALQNRMDETLGWTGLGNCDGGSTGSGTMEVCCIVVDFETAKRIIEQDLAETEFADYSRIFDEGAE